MDWKERGNVFFLEGERLFSTSSPCPRGSMPSHRWAPFSSPNPETRIKRGKKKDKWKEWRRNHSRMLSICNLAEETRSSLSCRRFTEAAGCKPPFSSSVYSFSDGRSLITTLSLRPRETFSFKQSSTKIHSPFSQREMKYLEGNLWGAELRDLLSQQSGLHPVPTLRFPPEFVCVWEDLDGGLASRCVVLPPGTAGRWSRLRLSDGLGVWLSQELEQKNRANTSFFVFTHLILWKTTKQLKLEHNITKDQNKVRLCNPKKWF